VRLVAGIGLLGDWNYEHIGMASAREIVVTGIGVVSPIGIGRAAFRAGLESGASGVREIQRFDTNYLPVNFGAELADFDGKDYVKPRKAIKLMARPLQTSFAAAELAVVDAGLSPGSVSTDRFGVVLGSELFYLEVDEMVDAYSMCAGDGTMDKSKWYPAAAANLNPLWMLRYLPNMPACHIGIAHDARGHNNTIVSGDASGILAIGEAMRTMERGNADVMLTGGVGQRINLNPLMRREGKDLSKRRDNPTAASRPFDADRDGQVNGEGTAIFVLETREHAERRGAKILARMLSFASTFQSPVAGQPIQSDGIARSIRLALAEAGVSPAQVGHVNAHGLSTIPDDIAEAIAIRSELGDTPVTALKSYFGNLGAGSGPVELAGSLLNFASGHVPRTLNYERPDPQCPVNVVHGQPLTRQSPILVKLSQSTTGQCAALVVAAE